MVGLKLACPKCKAILKSKKTLPVGKRVTCVQCKEQFFFAPEMLSEAALETQDDGAFSLAETQAGTLPSPIAGMTLPEPAATVTAGEPPLKKKPKPMPVEAEPEEATIERGHHTSYTPVWAALIFFVLIIAVSGGGVAIYYFYFHNAPAVTRPVAVTPKKPVEIEEPPPDPVKPDDKKPKKIVPVVNKPNPVTPKIDDNLKGKIDFATRKGVTFLKQTIKPSGTWKEDNGTHAVGYAALPGLALLECGVPATDATVQQCAKYVRANILNVKETYDIGTTLLFLDTLNDPADKNLIKALAMRLIAGQTAAGGWSYECPTLSLKEEIQLGEFLMSHKPEVKLLIPLPTFIEDNGPMPKKVKPKEIIEEPKKEAPPGVESLAPDVRKLPVVANKKGFQTGIIDDNSNTHFALLGLWAARRHDLPVELSLERAFERFQKTQAKDGGWGYVVKAPPKNTMTCVGLIGLAMGHGSAAELVAEAAAKNKTLPKKLAQDPAIQHALTGLGKYLDGDESLVGLEARIDLYYLWTLERVGMLYRQKRFGKTDWYTFGAKQILERQNDDGRWAVHYDAPVDTAFALLFLNRSDLVEDLTHNLHTYLAIPDATPRTHSRPEELRPRERERPGHTRP